MKIGSRFIGQIAAALIAATSIWLAANPARADDQPATAVSAPLSSAQAEALIKTLQDPDARGKLIAQLQLLTEVQKKAEPPPSAATGLVKTLAATLENAGDSILEAAADIADIGNVVTWAANQIDNERTHHLALRVAVRLVVVFSGGLILEWLLHRALVRPRRYIESRPIANHWLRIPLAAAQLIVELVPVAGFAASAYALLALPFYRPGGHSEAVSVAVITAYAGWATARTVIRAVFAPDMPGIRVLTLKDEDAQRLTFWARRMLRTAIWGYYFDDVLRLVGMPQSAFASLLKLLGLWLSAMLVSMVIEYRKPVSRWIRGSATATAQIARPELNRRITGVRRGVAEIWHVLAMIYILAAFIIWALRVEGGFEYLLRATLLSAAILVVARLATGVLGRLIDKAFAPSTIASTGISVVAARRYRYARLTRLTVNAVIAIAAVMAVFQCWGADTLDWFETDPGQNLLRSAGTIVGVIVVAVGVWEAVNGAIERYLTRTDPEGKPLARSSRARTLLPLMRNAFTVLVVLIVALIVLSEVGVNVAPLIAGAGVVGVAIGFGSQKLVQDVITGAFILFEDTVQIGDTVTIGSHSGVVEGMSIRTLRIRSGTGDLHTVPFSAVSDVINQSRGFAIFPFSIGVPYGEDIDKLIAIMREVGEGLRADKNWSRQMGGPVEVFGIDKFTDMSVVVAGQIRTAAGEQANIGREFYRRLKKRFDELGIILPHAISAAAEPKSAVAQPAPPAPTEKPAEKAPEEDRREP